MKLEPGYYKIRKKDYHESYGKKHPRHNPNITHLLKVVGSGAKQMLYIDQDTVGRLATEFLDIDEYEIISKYDREPTAGNVHFVISFADASGERFNWTVKDAWSLRDVFDNNPWLKEPFNYSKKKK